MMASDLRMDSGPSMGTGTHPCVSSHGSQCLFLQMHDFFLYLHLSLQNMMQLSGTSELRRKNWGNCRVLRLGGIYLNQPYQADLRIDRNQGYSELPTSVFTVRLVFAFLGSPRKIIDFLWAYEKSSVCGWSIQDRESVGDASPC